MIFVLLLSTAHKPSRWGQGNYERSRTMSGGRFDYADEHAMNEIFGICDADNIPNVFEDREISELVYDVFNLIHDFDWYACNDTGKEDYLESKQRFKKKWFGTKRGLRIKRIIDDAIERTRAELYETFGEEQEHE